MATLPAFCNEISPNESLPRDDKYLEELSSEERNELFTAFYPNVREKNGENYKKSALMGLRFGLQRHFLLKKNVNIISDQESKMESPNPVDASYRRTSVSTEGNAIGTGVRKRRVLTCRNSGGIYYELNLLLDGTDWEKEKDRIPSLMFEINQLTVGESMIF